MLYHSIIPDSRVPLDIQQVIDIPLYSQTSDCQFIVKHQWNYKELNGIYKNYTTIT